MVTYDSPQSPSNFNIFTFLVTYKYFLSFQNKNKATEF